MNVCFHNRATYTFPGTLTVDSYRRLPSLDISCAWFQSLLRRSTFLGRKVKSTRRWIRCRQTILYNIYTLTNTCMYVRRHAYNRVSILHEYVHPRIATTYTTIDPSIHRSIHTPTYPNHVSVSNPNSRTRVCGHVKAASSIASAHHESGSLVSRFVMCD